MKNSKILRKNIQPKNKSNPKRQRKYIPKEKDLIKPTKGLFSHLIDFNYLCNPFVRPSNPYPNDPMNYLKAATFATIIEKIHKFSLKCLDPRLTVADIEYIESHYEDLKNEIKQIGKLLTFLIPDEPKKSVKKNYYLRAFEFVPEVLVKIVDEFMIPDLNTHLEDSYKGKNKGTGMHSGLIKEEDVIKYFEKKSKKPYPDNINMDLRSKSTIAVSLVAYRLKCDKDKLLDILYKARKSIKPHKKFFGVG